MFSEFWAHITSKSLHGELTDDSVWRGQRQREEPSSGKVGRTARRGRVEERTLDRLIALLYCLK